MDNKKLLEIINFYGVNNQQRKLQEEIFELQEAITLFECGKGYIEHVVEEISDVLVLVEEFIEYYELSDDEIEKVQKYKIDRQLKRMR